MPRTARLPSDVRSLARQHTQGALETILGIMYQPKSPPAVRLAAAQTLWDRGWGKAATIIDTPDGQPLQLVERRIVYTSAQQMLEHVASEAARDVTPAASGQPVIDDSPIEDDNPRIDADAIPTTISSEAPPACEPQAASDWRSALATKRAADNDKAKVRVHRVRKPKSQAKPGRKAKPKHASGSEGK